MSSVLIPIGEAFHVSPLHVHSFPTEGEEETDRFPSSKNFIDVALQHPVKTNRVHRLFGLDFLALLLHLMAEQWCLLRVHVGLMEVDSILLPAFLPFSQSHDPICLRCQHSGF